MKKTKTPARSAAIVDGKIRIGTNEQWGAYYSYLAEAYLTYPTCRQVPAKYAKQAAEFAFGS